MIHYKDLMIGNWVYSSERTKFPMRVVNIGEDYCYLDFEGNEGDVWEVKDKDMMPIPLTEDIFNKNGFSYLCGVYYLEECTNPEFYKGEDGYFYMSVDLKEYKLSEQPIKYVHELQNIVRLITKSDLEIKEL